jgi:ribosome-associated protein
MLRVNAKIEIPDSEIHFTFARSSGPGGQNVNKVSSKAVLRWDALASTALPPEVRERFLTRYASRLTSEGELLITSQKYRDQARNIADARAKLAAMLSAVAAPPKKRRPTKPTRASIERRAKIKQTTSRKKQLRRPVQHED